MQVQQKGQQIGILQSLGASQRQVARIFWYKGLGIGGVGVLGSVLLSLSLLAYLNYSSYLLPDIYYDRTVPFEIRPLSWGVIYLMAVLLIVLAIWYPTRRAMQVDPVVAIRENG